MDTTKIIKAMNKAERRYDAVPEKCVIARKRLLKKYLSLRKKLGQGG